MVSAKKVIDAVLLPSRKIDGFAIKQVGNVLKRAPKVWSRIPQKVKDQLGNQESLARRALDSIVTVGVPFGALAIADKIAGAAFDPYRAIGSWYTNHPLLAAGVTLGAATAVVDVTNRAWHYIPQKLHVNLPKIGRTAYTTLGGTGIAAALLVASAFVGPSGQATQPAAVAPTPTPTATAAPTSTPAATATPVPTPTLAAIVATATPTPSPVPPTPTPTSRPAYTPTPRPTATPTQAPTATLVPSPTPKPYATATPRPTATLSPTATPSPAQQLNLYFDTLKQRAQAGYVVQAIFYNDPGKGCFQLVTQSYQKDPAGRTVNASARTFVFSSLEQLTEVAGLMGVNQVSPVPSPMVAGKQCGDLDAYTKFSARNFNAPLTGSIAANQANLVNKILQYSIKK